MIAPRGNEVTIKHTNNTWVLSVSRSDGGPLVDVPIPDVASLMKNLQSGLNHTYPAVAQGSRGLLEGAIKDALNAIGTDTQHYPEIMLSDDQVHLVLAAIMDVLYVFGICGRS